MSEAFPDPLLRRLEDEEVFARLVGDALGTEMPIEAFPPRASGMIAAMRALPGGPEAALEALGGRVPALTRLVNVACASRETPPVLLHHLALYHARLAGLLVERADPRAGAAAVNAASAWLLLRAEAHYLAALEATVLGPSAQGPAGPPAKARRAQVCAFHGASPELGLVRELGAVAERDAGTSGERGRSALAALAALSAAPLSGDEGLRAALAQAAAQAREHAVDSALSVLDGALTDAAARDLLRAEGPAIFGRASAVWAWAEHDERVERFIVGRIDVLGWELYRAAAWPELRALLAAVRHPVESLASRVERSPLAAHAAACAQVLIFAAEAATDRHERVALAERAVAVCPTHRNARVVLAGMRASARQGGTRFRRS